MKRRLPESEKLVKINRMALDLPYLTLVCYVDNAVVREPQEIDLVTNDPDTGEEVRIPVRFAKCPRCKRYLVSINVRKQERIFAHVEDLIHRGKL